VRKEMQKVLPGFAFKKSVERLRTVIKKALRKDELANKDVADAVSFIEKKTMKKGDH
jgi:cobalamin biosynthesis protein CbiG